ncbi:MAG TPA: hypothetical protein VHU91_03185 [Mycobacteriales bacterium]|nr:hypothetical protein [Mycobacteriales bacterium]
MAELKSRQLMRAWRLWLVFLVAATFVLAGVGAYILTQPTVYSASSVVALRPKGVHPAQADVVLLTAPRYVSLATSPYVLNQVARQVRVDAKDLYNGVTVSVAPNTANLAIKVTLQQRRFTAPVANALAGAIVDRADADTILAAQILSRAVEPSAPSGPKRIVTLGAGAVVAVVIGAGAAWLFGRHLRRRARLVRGVATVRPIALTKPPSSDVGNAVPAKEPAESAEKLEIKRPDDAYGGDAEASVQESVTPKPDADLPAPALEEPKDEASNSTDPEPPQETQLAAGKGKNTSSWWSA